MQPQAQPDGRRADGFKPKYRHFHPMDRVWVQNPFDHDVVYQVADEYNRPFRYRLPAHQVSELPGGAIATLGVKAIIDELIQNTQGDEMSMWDENIRRKHENDVILRVKQTSPVGDPSTPGEVDLSVKSNEVPAPVAEAPAPPEEAFPGLNQPVAPIAPPAAPAIDPLPASVAAGMQDMIGASLPATDAVVGANNTHADAEG